MKIQLYVNLIEIEGEYHLVSFQTKQQALDAMYIDFDNGHVIARALPYGYERLEPTIH